MLLFPEIGGIRCAGHIQKSEAKANNNRTHYNFKILSTLNVVWRDATNALFLVRGGQLWSGG